MPTHVDKLIREYKEKWVDSEVQRTIIQAIEAIRPIQDKLGICYASLHVYDKFPLIITDTISLEFNTCWVRIKAPYPKFKTISKEYEEIIADPKAFSNFLLNVVMELEFNLYGDKLPFHEGISNNIKNTSQFIFTN